MAPQVFSMAAAMNEAIAHALREEQAFLLTLFAEKSKAPSGGATPGF